MKQRGTANQTEAGPSKAQAREIAYQSLRSGILAGHYHPSQHLVEQSIAEQLRVSKTPVREALTRLEQDGLVKSFPHRGFFVRDFTEREFRQVYELRELYEGACARAASQRAGHAEVAERLDVANQAARTSFAGGHIDDVHRHFSEFDEIIFAQTDNELLQQEVARIWAQIYLMGVVTNQIPGRIETSIGQHDKIVGAVRDGDPDAAERRTRLHIRSLMEDELEHRRRTTRAWSVIR
ncbi:GntR family transcriptional regulator [Actinophytocola sp.]|uniref:GntR family transcriptional regulator n=1 Tax=Actinophytocola sp. TaxID=1872138 RepID=UPI003D6BA266